MDFRDRSIITQVAFKGAVELSRGVDITDPDGQARFELAFSYLTESIFNAVGDPEDQAARVIQAHFPGAVQVAPAPTPLPQQQPQQQFAMAGPGAPQQQNYSPVPQPLSVKGQQFGPLPDWLFAQAAAKGVTEVYDNRDRIANSNRPWFKATSGGPNATGFWPPRS